MSAPIVRPDWPSSGVDHCKDCGALTVFDDLHGQPQCVRCFDRAFAAARACYACEQDASGGRDEQGRPQCQTCRDIAQCSCYACGQVTACRDEQGRPLCPSCWDARDDARSYEHASGGR
jgi:hypothetical protein